MLVDQGQRDLRVPEELHAARFGPNGALRRRRHRTEFSLELANQNHVRIDALSGADVYGLKLIARRVHFRIQHSEFRIVVENLCNRLQSSPASSPRWIASTSIPTRSCPSNSSSG